MLEMRKRVAGGQIDDAAIVHMLDELEQALRRLRELKPIGWSASLHGSSGAPSAVANGKRGSDE